MAQWQTHKKESFSSFSTLPHVQLNDLMAAPKITLPIQLRRFGEQVWAYGSALSHFKKGNVDSGKRARIFTATFFGGSFFLD